MFSPDFAMAASATRRITPLLAAFACLSFNYVASPVTTLDAIAVWRRFLGTTFCCGDWRVEPLPSIQSPFQRDKCPH